jgi:hypothetical protein
MDHLTFGPILPSYGGGASAGLELSHVVVAHSSSVVSNHHRLSGTITWRYDTFMACLEDGF